VVDFLANIFDDLWIHVRPLLASITRLTTHESWNI
jgi:hypothetical protein